jgi:hypothetical protein
MSFDNAKSIKVPSPPYFEPKGERGGVERNCLELLFASPSATLYLALLRADNCTINCTLSLVYVK